jgi:hypothetical protein
MQSLRKDMGSVTLSIMGSLAPGKGVDLNNAQAVTRVISNEFRKIRTGASNETLDTAAGNFYVALNAFNLLNADVTPAERGMAADLLAQYYVTNWENQAKQ